MAQSRNSRNDNPTLLQKLRNLGKQVKTMDDEGITRLREAVKETQPLVINEAQNRVNEANESLDTLIEQSDELREEVKIFRKKNPKAKSRVASISERKSPSHSGYVRLAQEADEETPSPKKSKFSLFCCFPCDHEKNKGTVEKQKSFIRKNAAHK